MKYVTKSTNTEFQAILARRKGKPSGFMLSWILKSGKPSKPRFYRAYGGEKTAEELIATLEKLNPNTVFVIPE